MDPNKHEYSLQSMSRDKTIILKRKESDNVINHYITFQQQEFFFLPDIISLHGEIAVGEVVTGEIVLGKLRWGNDLTPIRVV